MVIINIDDDDDDNNNNDDNNDNTTLPENKVNCMEYDQVRRLARVKYPVRYKEDYLWSLLLE